MHILIDKIVFDVTLYNIINDGSIDREFYFVINDFEQLVDLYKLLGIDTVIEFDNKFINGFLKSITPYNSSVLFCWMASGK